MGIPMQVREKPSFLYENLYAANTREGTIRFALWAAQCRDLTASRVQPFLGCSRASPRYLAAFKAVRGEA